MRPGCERPRAYEDDSMQAEYDLWVRPEIERGYVADLDVIRDALSADEECSCSPTPPRCRLDPRYQRGQLGDGGDRRTARQARVRHTDGAGLAPGGAGRRAGIVTGAAFRTAN